MAYVKTNWQTGDVITAGKLNNMESGIEAAGRLDVNIIPEQGGTSEHLDKTYTEIVSANTVRFLDKSVPGATSIYTLAMYGENEGTYYILILSLENPQNLPTVYTAPSADGVLTKQGET